MCGIAGYLLRHGVPAELPLVQAMCDTIRYRGPDQEGYHVRGSCALGSRRLSIIDPATGHQPLANEDRSVWVVFNGEIYNFQELRQSLIERGHRFATASDTESLIHLYEEEGVDGLRRLRGMFACAIWDGRKKELLLARDRFGKKPLYYAVCPQGLFFGSELKCLRAAGVPLEPDPMALRLYFQFGYIPDPWTPFHQVRKLPPASWLIYSSAGKLREGRYWRLPSQAPDASFGWTEREAEERLRRELDEAVRQRLVSDVPVGAFLSGGIDSSSVVASMALQTAAPVKTFSIGFDEAEFNELPYAREVARKYGTEHHEAIVRPNAIALVSSLIRHFDEPFTDSSAIPTFVVSELASQYVKVVLTGDGGDELFGGYDTLAKMQRLRWADSIPSMMRAGLASLAAHLPHGAYGKNYLRVISRPSALTRYFELCSPRFLREQLLPSDWILPDGMEPLFRALPHAFLTDENDILRQVQHFEATAKLAGDILVKVDRMSMANSLEVRCPLLDHNLAELAMRFPMAWKLRQSVGKQIFRQAVGNRLPQSVLSQPKRGFGVPLAAWFRGPLREFTWDHLTDARATRRGIVSTDAVQCLLREHESGRRDNSHCLWALLMFELWYRDFEEASPDRESVAGIATPATTPST